MPYLGIYRAYTPSTVPVGVGLTFPRVALVGIGGDQSYGCNATTGFPPWTTAPGGSAANIAIQNIASYDLPIISGTFEGWDQSGRRDRENLVQACLKNASYPIVKSVSRIPYPFFYCVLNETTPTGSGNQTFVDLVTANNWWLYESPGGTGTITPSAFTSTGAQLVNYSAAYPGAVGSAGIGQSIAGTNYGTLSSGFGPARSCGSYVTCKILIKSQPDPRFIFNPQMAAPSAAGIFLDNVFAALNGGGSVANSSLDGLTLTSGSSNTVSPLMARGNHNFFDQTKTVLTSANPLNTYYSLGNFGQYADQFSFGSTTLTAGLESTLQGGLLEAAMGGGASSWEWFERSGSDPSGWNNTRLNYYQGMDFCLFPKLVALGIRLPSTDGSAGGTASWGIGGVLTTITTGTLLEYQCMRYGLCTTLLDDGYFGNGPHNYDYATARWYDEFGDDSLTQVNVPRGYLGYPLTPRPTAPLLPGGFFGLWGRFFTGGAAYVNPRGNGVQTFALPRPMTKLLGTQQPSINNGATVSTVTLQDGDGIILRG